ncbi:unnamed protein product, partial [Polarella glacialis]
VTGATAEKTTRTVPETKGGGGRSTWEPRHPSSSSWEPTVLGVPRPAATRVAPSACLAQVHLPRPRELAGLGWPSARTSILGRAATDGISASAARQGAQSGALESANTARRRTTLLALGSCLTAAARTRAQQVESSDGQNLASSLRSLGTLQEASESVAHSLGAASPLSTGASGPVELSNTVQASGTLRFRQAPVPAAAQETSLRLVPSPPPQELACAA